MAKKTKTVARPAWRPNFRNDQELPDVKVVRTQFLLNFISLALLTGLIANLLISEYKLISLQTQLDQLTEQINSNTQANDEAEKLSKQFTDKSKIAEEIIDFYNIELPVTEVIMLIVSQLPDEAVLMNFDINSTAANKGKSIQYDIILRGSVGDRDTTPASKIISDWLDEMRNNKLLPVADSGITLSSFERNANLGVHDFSISLRLRK